MQVSIKKFAVAMELKNSGIELEVRDNNGDFLGDLVINKRSLIWCRGRTSRRNGIHAEWANFIAMMEEAGSN